MTIESTQSQVIYKGGSTTPYPIPFRIDKAEQVQCSIISTDHTERILAQNSFRIQGIKEKSPSLELLEKSNANDSIVIKRSLRPLQLLDIRDGAPFHAASLMHSLDYLTMLIQQIINELERTIKVSYTEDSSLTNAQAFLQELKNYLLEIKNVERAVNNYVEKNKLEIYTHAKNTKQEINERVKETKEYQEAACLCASMSKQATEQAQNIAKNISGFISNTQRLQALRVNDKLELENIIFSDSASISVEEYENLYLLPAGNRFILKEQELFLELPFTGGSTVNAKS